MNTQNRIKLYWWRPVAPITSLLTEVRYHSKAWFWLLNHSGQGFAGLRNFGDEFSRIAVEASSRRAVEWKPIDKADVVSTGSLLNSYLKHDSDALVLGSGLRNDDGLVERDLSKLAGRTIFVRGRLTLNSLGLPDDLALGDPGILASAVYPAKKSTRAHPKRVFLPHFTLPLTVPGRELLSRLRTSGWDIVLPNASPSEVAESISSADLLLTTSLHGVVFAHSYGVPVLFLESDGLTREPAFKYKDYLSIWEGESLVSISESQLEQPSILERQLAEANNQTVRINSQRQGQIARIYTLLEQSLS